MAAQNRLSINQWSMRTTPCEQFICAVAAAGIESVGLWRQNVAEIGVRRAAGLVRGAGLRVSSLCRGGFLSAADLAGIAAALEDNRAAIREAQTLGTHELIMVVGGLPACPGPSAPALPHGDKDIVAARRRVSERIGELVGYAREHDVRLVLEPLHPIFAADRAVLSTLGQCLDVAAGFAPHEVGVVVDTYHVWWDPQLADMIARAGREGRIASYQICDWTLPLAADALLSRGHVGDGYIDFPTITGWVATTGYDGDIEVEIFNEAIWATPGEQTLATMKERYDRLVAPFL